MSKVICDICGTTYAESASQCPICGYAKPENPATVNHDTGATSADGGYTYVKGGRFSAANVKKRNKAAAAVPPATEIVDDVFDDEEEEAYSNRGLIIAIILLFLAIVAVGAYIYFRFLAPPDASDDPNPAITTTAPGETTTELMVPCSDIQISDEEVVLTEVGMSWLLNVQAQPADTTDEITYASSNEAVAIVSDDGRVTAAGPGEAQITITCGGVTKTCNVSCEIAPPTEPTDPPTEPTDPPTEPTDPPTEPTEPPIDPAQVEACNAECKKLHKFDVTLYLNGSAAEKTFTITFKDSDGNIVEDVEWKSTNPENAKVDGNVVRAVSTGTALIYCEYNGEVHACLVRVNNK